MNREPTPSPSNRARHGPLSSAAARHPLINDPRIPNFSFEGSTPTLVYRSAWNIYLRGEVAKNIQSKSGLEVSQARAIHNVVEDYVESTWLHRGNRLYEGRLVDPARSRALADEIMLEVICTDPRESVKEFFERNAELGSQHSQQQINNGIAAFYFFLRGDGLSNFNPEVVQPIPHESRLPLRQILGNRPSVTPHRERMGAALPAPLPSKSLPPVVVRPQSRPNMQDITIHGAPSWYVRWVQHIEQQARERKVQLEALSREAGAVRSFVEFHLDAARRSFGQNPKKSEEIAKVANDKICQSPKDALREYLEPLRDGEENRKYHSHRQILLKSLYPWLKQQNLTKFSSVFDSIYRELELPVGRFYADYFEFLASEVEDREDRSARHGGKIGMSREDAVQAGRMVRSYIENIAQRLRVSEMPSEDAIQLVEMAIFTEPRQQLTAFVRERYADSAHWRDKAWFDLHEHFYSWALARGLTTYDPRHGYFVPYDAQVSHPTITRWIEQHVQMVYSPVPGQEPFHRPRATIRCKVVQSFIDFLSQEKFIAPYVQVDLGAKPHEMRERALWQLLELDPHIFVEEFGNEQLKKGESDVTVDRAKKLLLNEYYPLVREFRSTNVGVSEKPLSAPPKPIDPNLQLKSHAELIWTRELRLPDGTLKKLTRDQLMNHPIFGAILFQRSTAGKLEVLELSDAQMEILLKYGELSTQARN